MGMFFFVVVNPFLQCLFESPFGILMLPDSKSIDWFLYEGNTGA